MKGIVLAGGTGSRLFPITLAVSKQLLPIYDKPMIYYPISVLMLAGIREILVITTPIDMDSYKRLLGDGADFGIKIEYEIQEKPEGLAQAFIIGEKFIGRDSVTLILGDNIFFGQGFTPILQKAVRENQGGTIFGYQVQDPKDFGVVELDVNWTPLSIEEKPKVPKSNYAVTGLYVYNNDVIGLAKTIKPSSRGELEITALNQIYLEKKQLKVQVLGRGFAWLDTGTHENLLDAAHFVATIEKRQGWKIACLEEIAFNFNWINAELVLKAAEKYKNSTYGIYLNKMIEDRKIK